jgi:Rrf2 family transcriptional regulator, iron-sulfur cluster assembly transcription factor
MPLLARKSILAIAAVVEIAINARTRPITAKVLAARYSLPSRHFEPALQALVRDGILRGIRGPRGGYELARERSRISAEQILRAAGTAEDVDQISIARSQLLNKVVMPALGEAERAFAAALAGISVENLILSAESLHKRGEHAVAYEHKSLRPAI